MSTPIRFGDTTITLTCSCAALKAIEQTFHTLIDGSGAPFRTIKADELAAKLEGSMVLQQNFVLACIQTAEGDKPKTTMKDVEALFSARFSGPKDGGANARELADLLRMEIFDAWGEDPNLLPSALESRDVEETRQMEKEARQAERNLLKARAKLRTTLAEKNLAILNGPGTEPKASPSGSDSAPESSGA